MANFEERLYKHWMYTNALSNMSYDMVSEIEDEFGYEAVKLEYGDSGKYATLLILPGHTVDEIANHIEYIRDLDDSYYEGLQLIREEDRILLYINI